MHTVSADRGEARDGSDVGGAAAPASKLLEGIPFFTAGMRANEMDDGCYHQPKLAERTGSGKDKLNAYRRKGEPSVRGRGLNGQASLVSSREWCSTCRCWMSGKKASFFSSHSESGFNTGSWCNYGGTRGPPTN